VGASQIALATVVTSYFLRMGLGSAAVARWLRGRRWSPLFVYGLFEAGIGVFALAFPLLFRGLEGAYGLLYPVFEAHAAGLFLLRFGLVFALFLVPTFFMAGTLPLLLDGLVARDRSVGALTSFLYGLNILGAVMGALVTSYFAIPRLGMNGTSLAAGCCNLAIGAVALVSFRGLKPLHLQEAAGASAAPGRFYAQQGPEGLARSECDAQHRLRPPGAGIEERGEVALQHLRGEPVPHRHGQLHAPGAEAHAGRARSARSSRGVRRVTSSLAQTAT
jgi:hypothetical protein